MNFIGLRRAVFRSLVAFSLAFAPLCGMSLTETAVAAPAKGKAAKGKAAKASAGKRAGGKHARSGSRGGHRHAWHRHSGNHHGKGSRSSRRHAPQPDEADASPAQATPTPPARQTAAKPTPVDNSRAVVSLVASGAASTSARIASDLASVLDSDSLRVLPVIGKGTLADLRDLGNSGLGDLALLQSDSLANLPRDEREAVSARLAYVARLYNEEVHIVAARDVTDLRQLAGRKVNIGREGSSTALTARLIFDRLGIAPNYVQADQPTALSQLKSDDLAAIVMVGGRPIKALTDLAGEGRFRLLPIPYEAALQDSYLPARLTSTDYADLVAPGETIPTVAVGILLATVDAPEGSPRYRRVQRFSEAFFANFEALRDPARHPKWREVNMAAKVSGWTRFQPAQDWLDGRRGIAEARSAGAPAVPGDEVGPSGVESDDAQQQLYQQYREWKRQREKWRKQ